VIPLEQRAETWIEPYWNAHHLVRARDYAVELDPSASQAVHLAALTHDIERHFPGGPRFDPRTMPPDDPAYNREHSERSARFVSEWLRGEDADDALVVAVDELVRLHEWGGTLEADVVQAADSLSFFEVNWEIVTLRWVREGRASPAQARAKLDWMLERIRLADARDLALPLHARAVERLEAAA
jgi:hypothetical protein